MMVKKDSTLNLQMKDVGAEVFILQEMRVTVTITEISTDTTVKPDPKVDGS